MTIVYDKYIDDDIESVFSTYKEALGSSIADCTSVCEQESKCVYTDFYSGVCYYYELVDGAVKASINGLPVFDWNGTGYAIKQ